MAEVLLLAPPWRIPNQSNVGISTLRGILAAGGVDADELHGTLLFPRTVTDPDGFMSSYGRYLFSPYLNDCDARTLAERVARRVATDAKLGGLLPRNHIDEPALATKIHDDMVKAGVCLERIVERVADGDYAVIAMSATFDMQIPAAVAIARRVRRARPDVGIVLGGAACFDEQADGLLASFPSFDVVCHCEGERTIVPLIGALCGDGELADVPGISWRNGAIVHSPAPPLFSDMDSLPVPDYAPFLDQLAASEWSDLPARLLFETSRGCWWGQKKLCTFCGLNSSGVGFRSKSAARAVDEITSLYRDYPTADRLEATDNIVEMSYLTDVFPALAELPRDRDRPLQIFYEVKANMRPAQIAAMAAGGVTLVQPGIESFSDEILALMRKGCIGLGQVQFIKWATEAGVDLTYLILICNPGEEARWYEPMAELIPYIRHLQPPSTIVPTMLERFSPYFADPGRYGISNVRPTAFYADMYAGEDVDLSRIAYRFDGDYAAAEPCESRRRVVAAVLDWIAEWKPDTLFYVERDDGVVIVDRRGEIRLTRLSGVRAAVFRRLDRYRKRASLRDKFADLDDGFVDCLLETWLHQRIVCRDAEDRWVSVVPRSRMTIDFAGRGGKPPAKSGNIDYALGGALGTN